MHRIGEGVVVASLGILFGAVFYGLEATILFWVTGAGPLLVMALLSKILPRYAEPVWGIGFLLTIVLWVIVWGPVSIMQPYVPYRP